jgi:uncharacterized protein
MNCAPATRSLNLFVLDEASFAHLTEELGWLSPFYLRQIALQMRPSGPVDEGNPIATIADVEAAFVRLLSPNQRNQFAAWEEHIDKNFGDLDTQRLRAILDVACDAPDGEVEATMLTRLGQSGNAPTQNELRGLMQSLETDGFLSKTNNRWHFRSGLLRRYWKEYMHNG